MAQDGTAGAGTERAEDGPGRLAGRIVLVTGASRGIGRAVAKAVAAEGAHVIAVARPHSVGALESLDDEIRALGGSATLTPFDLTDGDAIDRLGAAIYERWGRVDALIGNAGRLGVLSPVTHIDPKEWERTFAVNVHANFRLIRSLDPLLRQAEDARAIFVTSGAARRHKAYWGLYAASKAALETLVLTYAAECRLSGVKVNLVNPGPVRTAMRAQAYPGEDPETLPTPEAVAPLFLELLDPACTLHGRRIDFADWQPGSLLDCSRTGSPAAAD
ncbi:MAG: SDR family NAD(P)-dependent oxidoreductase [Alphaproteobacteria bacterium]|nr:MAG: SDR family NAD(P)-dependent oxidoreductase [Alphaproteobacteria bacterium]